MYLLEECGIESSKICWRRRDSIRTSVKYGHKRGDDVWWGWTKCLFPFSCRFKTVRNPVHGLSIAFTSFLERMNRLWGIQSNSLHSLWSEI